MGGGGKSPKMPEPAPMPEFPPIVFPAYPAMPSKPEPEEGEEETLAQKDAREKQRRAMMLSRGRSSTVLSGLQGGETEANVKKTVLG